MLDNDKKLTGTHGLPEGGVYDQAQSSAENQDETYLNIKASTFQSK